MTEPELSAREKAVADAGIVVRNPADEKMYPVPGQGITKRKTDKPFELPIIDVQQLQSAPTLKSWIEARDGQPLKPSHIPIVAALKNARKNGAPINLNVNEEGYYDLAFSGANGNAIHLDDFERLLAGGLNLGDALRATKLVCGPNGSCGNPGPCAICRDIRDGGYRDGVYVKEREPEKIILPATDPIAEEINAIVLGEDYRIHGERIVNLENSKSAGVDEVRSLCRSTGKSVVYVLELLGVYRKSEAASHTALKRGDLGGK